MKNILKYLSAQLFRGFRKFVYHSFKKKFKKNIDPMNGKWKTSQKTPKLHGIWQKKLHLVSHFFDISSNIRILS